MKRLGKLAVIFFFPLLFLGGPLEGRTVRPPTVAGQFYPADPVELYKQIDQLMKAAPRAGVRGVRAVLVPHAGYPFSAAVAAASFREVTAFSRVFLLASNHRGDIDFSGVSIPDETHYAVPGATIPLSNIVRELMNQPEFVKEPAAHTMHMIEVELPFLHFLQGQPEKPRFEIVPMILGKMDQPAIRRLAAILNRYADARTLFVFSVDLSHYYPDEKARELDSHTIRSIMSRDPAEVSRAVTDGNQVLLTMLELARLRGWEPTSLAYRNSGDATGDKGRVVGYASIVFHEPLFLTPAEKKDLIEVARRAIEEAVRGGAKPATSSHPIFNIPRAVFVTLKKNGTLRGCIGGLFPEGTLIEGVLRNAVNAALHDGRFPPVTAAELPDLAITISVLDYPQRVEVSRPSDYLQILKPRQDGVILIHGERRSTFLPEVWEEIPSPQEFLSKLCLKQGSPSSCWQEPETSLYRYRAYAFGGGKL